MEKVQRLDGRGSESSSHELDDGLRYSLLPCESKGSHVQYHEVRVTFEFEEAANIPGISITEPLSAELWADYVYLDQEEREIKEIFAQKSPVRYVFGYHTDNSL
jgi:hypothetical protein